MVKLIRLEVRDGHREAILRSQAVWNRESRKAPGYIGEFVGDGEPNELYVITTWRSRGDYERWMREDHDRIAALAASEAHYTQLETRTIDGLNL